MNVLSCFDGMSCGQIALERARFKVENYFASEIDKYAIQVTQKNYPNTIQLGSIEDWREWELPEIDLIMGGSPCQGFSVAGRGLNFDDPRSKLFFTFVDIVRHYRPKYFLLENVRMKKEWRDVITEYMGMEPILIDSALVSAQSRKRLYWTNIMGVEQPEDRHIYLKDIIEPEPVDEIYYVRKGHAGHPKELDQKAGCLTGGAHSGGAHSGGNHSDMTLIAGGAIRGRYKEDGSTEQQVEIRSDGKSNSLTTVQKDNVVEVPDCIGIISDEIRPKGNYLPRERVFSLNGKSRVVSTVFSQYPYYKDTERKLRRLTPLECERLQTVPEGYTDGVSNSQRYKCLGNGWTVEVIVGILKNVEDTHELVSR